MFNRRIFYLIVLSILHDHKEGLSAYQLLKILKEHFTPLWNPSAGALYPLLRKMTITGEIKEEMGDSDQSRFVITEIGLKRLQDIIPEVLNTSFESLPLIFDALSKVLPYALRMRFAHHVPHIFRMMAQNFPFNEPTRDEHFNGYSTSTRMERLENYKADLNKAKERSKVGQRKKLLELMRNYAGSMND